jgi:hypothetical protein
MGESSPELRRDVNLKKGATPLTTSVEKGPGEQGGVNRRLIG